MRVTFTDDHGWSIRYHRVSRRICFRRPGGAADKKRQGTKPRDALRTRTGMEARVRVAATFWGRALVGLTALLSLWQGLVPVNGHCQHNSPAARPRVESSLDSQPTPCFARACSDSNACGTAARSTCGSPGETEQRFPAPDGRKCPPTCPCRVQHAPLEAVIANPTVLDAKPAIGGVPAWKLDVVRDTEPPRSGSSILGWLSSTCASAVLRCALLCRFVV